MITRNMTKPPCYREGRDCERRYIGCRASCSEWHDWLVIHAQEKEEQDAKRQKHRDVEGFLAQQGKRTRTDNQRKYLQRKNGNIRREV